jgi:mannose-6-phosphate isomerase-like protein (cupin superfamily)
MPMEQLEGKTSAIGLIGGIGLTEVHVYAQRPAPDGKFSGCPHVHAVTDEGYFVLQGTGYVEFHDTTNGYRRLSLEPGQYVHFPPLIMHRLVSDGDLIILGMMGNAGLAERGEARIYFGKDVDEDPKRFIELQSLPQRMGLDGALARRDAAVAAYLHFMQLWNDDRRGYFAELRRFIACHCQAMAERSEVFLEQVRQGPVAWAEATEKRIRQLPAVPTASKEVYQSRRGAESALGMCGVLRPILRLQPLAPSEITPAGQPAQ